MIEEIIDITDEYRQPCEIWTRVMGYHRPVQSFNKGKQTEFRDRIPFKEKIFSATDIPEICE